MTWIVDGDAGGAAIKKKLRKARIPESRIFVLGGSKSGLVLEDLLNSDVYVTAVNAELERSGRTQRITKDDLLGNNRPAKLEAWCRKKRIPCPNKTDVASRVLDQKQDRTLVEPKRKALLRKLEEKLGSSFGSIPNQ